MFVSWVKDKLLLHMVHGFHVLHGSVVVLLPVSVQVSLMAHVQTAGAAKVHLVVVHGLRCGDSRGILRARRRVDVVGRHWRAHGDGLIEHLIVGTIIDHGRSDWRKGELLLEGSGRGNEWVVVKVESVEAEWQLRVDMLSLWLKRLWCVERIAM